MSGSEDYHRTNFDVVIIGSGAAGATAAKVLIDRGAKVALLEAGRAVDPERDFTQHVWPYELESRGVMLPGQRFFGVPGLFISNEEEPYTNDPDSIPFAWVRARLLGGRTHHYGRISPRLSEYDFIGKSLDGCGQDWPIRYQDLAPYYAKVEKLIGVYGTEEDIPSAPNGHFLPPPAPRCVDLLIQRASQRLGMYCIPARVAVLTRSLNGRNACHYCGQCERGCKEGSTFDAARVLIEPATHSGNLSVITGAMTKELLVDASGLVRAASYVDTATRSEREIRGRVFVVAASSCESARLLLNSGGLANSSGQVGRNLTDTVASTVIAELPYLHNTPPHNHDGVGGLHLYCPWWLYDRHAELDFPRGYHIEFGGGLKLPYIGMYHDKLSEIEGYGSTLKEQLRSAYGSRIKLSARGEMIPNNDSYCEIDNSRVDRWGIPVLKFHWKWGETELAMIKHMKSVLSNMVTTLGGEVPASFMQEELPQQPGSVYHEMGTTRMGVHPGTSVVNGYCQAHDVKNLFIVDGGVFPTHPEKNPTLTIMALSWRASEYLLDEARKGNL